MRDPNAIISTEALAALLGQPNLHVYDCTTYNNPPPPGVDEPYIPLPGLATFCEAHIPVPIFWTCRASSPTGANATGL